MRTQQPIRGESPNISLEGSSKENYKDDFEEESQEKSTRELKKSKQQPQNGEAKVRS